MPENTPLFDVLCLGQDHLMDFSGTALEQPVDNRSRASHAKFHLERRCICLRQKAIKGSLHSHGRGGCIVLLQCFIIWQLHVVEAHQSTQKVCIHLAHGDQSEMRIHCHRFQRRHWATIVQAAERQTQLAAWWGHQHDSWLKPQAGTNVATLQFQGVVLLEGETAKKGHLKAKNASKNMTGRRKLSMQQSIYLSTYLIIYLCIHPCIHPSMSLSLHPSIYLCLSPYLSLSLPLSLSIYLSIDRSTCLSIHASIHQSIHLFLSLYLSIYLSDLSIFLSVYLSLHQDIYLSTNQSIYLSIDRSLWLSIHLSIDLSSNLSVQSNHQQPIHPA